MRPPPSLFYFFFFFFFPLTPKSRAEDTQEVILYIMSKSFSLLFLFKTLSFSGNGCETDCYKKLAFPPLSLFNGDVGV